MIRNYNSCKVAIFVCLLIIMVAEICCLRNEDEPKDLIASCLIRNNVKNFTLNHDSNTNESIIFFERLNFSLQNLRFSAPSVQKPVAIILPKSKDELVNAVLCCKKLSFQIRVRCGGHCYEGTTSVAESGAPPFVIIDMTNLDKIRVDVESESAWVEGGATLGQTYYEIGQSSDSHAFSAGSCPTVGIGGHVSGGGFGLLSRKYGLAADNVLDALLIDAEGRLLDRKTMGEDVFWAIRGGGGGVFGIVYAWKFKLVVVPKILTSFVASKNGTKEELVTLINKWQHIAPVLDDDFYLSCFVGAGLPERKGFVGELSASFKGFYLGPRKEAADIIKKVFPELSVEQQCVEMSWIESIHYFAGLGENSSIVDLKDRYLHDKNYFKAKSDYVRSHLSSNTIMMALNILEKEPKGYVILDPNGGEMERINSDAIAFPHRKGNLFSIQYLVEWKERDNGKSNEYIDWIREFYTAMEPYVSFGPRAAYVNYIDHDLGVFPNDDHKDDAVETARVWGEKYFLKNYDRLVRAKTEIDPFNVFNHRQSIPPLQDRRNISTFISSDESDLQKISDV